METISLVLWVLACAMLIFLSISSPKLNSVPICSITELVGAGGFVCVIDEYNAGALGGEVAVFLAIGMLSIMVFAITKFMSCYTQNVRVKI